MPIVPIPVIVPPVMGPVVLILVTVPLVAGAAQLIIPEPFTVSILPLLRLINSCL